MNEIFTRKWLISVVSVWIVVLILDELAFTWWRKVNPGSAWSGLFVKHPLTPTDNTDGEGYPNGYRPAGGP